MKLFAALALGAFATTFPRFGCQPRQTSVTLFNNTTSPVNVKVFYSDNQNVASDVIDDIGGEVDYTIPAGEPRSFSRDCDDLQAIKVEGDLQLISGLGPSESTSVFRDGTDFGCGAAMTFTFTSPNPLDLNIDFNTP